MSEIVMNTETIPKPKNSRSKGAVGKVLGKVACLMMTAYAFFFTSMAMAVLPTQEAPSGGSTNMGLMATIQAYAKEYGALIGLILCTVAFLLVASSSIATFREAQKKEEWGKFAITVVTGIILIVAVIWLATKAAAIL